MNSELLPADLPPFITSSELAGHFRVSRRTIGRWVIEGRLPTPIRLTDRIILFEVAALRDWILGREKVSAIALPRDQNSEPAIAPQAETALVERSDTNGTAGTHADNSSKGEREL